MRLIWTGVLWSVLAGALPVSPGVSVSRAQAVQEDLLARTAAIGDQPLPAALAFQNALQVSGVPGGVAFVEGCPDEPKPMIHPDGGKLRLVLDNIVSGGPQYVWNACSPLIFRVSPNRSCS
jgi:hypothetical protein